MIKITVAYRKFFGQCEMSMVSIGGYSPFGPVIVAASSKDLVAVQRR